MALKRKRCACGCRRWFSPDKASRQFLNRTHYLASPQFKAQVAKAAPLATVKRKENMARRTPTLQRFGPLTPREFAIYQRGLRTGEMRGRRGEVVQAAYRLGWAEACGERDTQRRTAA